MEPTLALIHSPLTTAAVWGSLSDALRHLDHEAVVPEVLDDDEPPYASRFIARIAQQLMVQAPDAPLVLVGHGAAGPLLPQIAFARHAAGVPVSGYVFVDALLPRTLRSGSLLELMEAADPVSGAVFAQHLTDGGRFPDWTDRELADRVADDGDRALLLASLRPRSLDFFTETLPLPEDWPDAPCHYIRLSDAFDAEARTAKLRGWQVEQREAHHFLALTNPSDLAHTIDDLLR